MKPFRSRAAASPSPCCAPYGGVFEADVVRDGFACSVCGRFYTVEETMDDILDLAAKPQPQASRAKLVPLSRTLDTYPVKDALKALGAKWDHVNRQWMVPDTLFQRAHDLVAHGPKNVTRPTVPFTRSQFGGLADDDGLSFEDLNTMSWADYNRRRQEIGTPPEAPYARPETRCCWECGTASEEQVYVRKGGSWDDYWCGCEGR